MTPHYAMNVAWSDSDDVWIADAPDLRFCSAHGDTPEQAIHALREAMEAWLAVAREGARPVPELKYKPLVLAAE